jgi:acetyl esterase/lipase
MSTFQSTAGLLHPPYDPELEVILNRLDLSALDTIEKIRALSSTATAASVLAAVPGLVHAEHTAPGPDGPVLLSIFSQESSTKTARPAVYVVHGGGQISGNRFSGLTSVMRYFEGLDVVTVAVEYRLAPEHPAPAALHDTYAGLVWAVEHAAQIGIDPERVLIVGGSGGAPIAAGCSMLAMRNQSPRLHAQMLLAPMLDDRGIMASAKQFERHGPWCGTINQMAWDCVLGPDRGSTGQEVGELVAPARATDLTGLPATFIDVGEAEVFRDEAVAYAMLLWKSGVSTELHVWKGAFHGFDMDLPGIVGKEAAVAAASVSAKKSWVRRILAADT